MDSWKIEMNDKTCPFRCFAINVIKSCGYMPCYNSDNKTRFCSEETCPIKLTIKETNNE